MCSPSCLTRLTCPVDVFLDPYAVSRAVWLDSSAVAASREGLDKRLRSRGAHILMAWERARATGSGAAPGLRTVLLVSLFDDAAARWTPS